MTFDDFNLLAVLILIVLFAWSIWNDFKGPYANHLRLRNKKLTHERDAALEKLGVAEKQLIDLRRTVPGRDNTGRFTKRDAKSDAIMGSE